MKNTILARGDAYAILDTNRREILERIIAGETAASIERRYINSDQGRVVRWTLSRFNLNPLSIRLRAKAKTLAIAEGAAYYFSASTSVKRKVAHKLDWEFGDKIKDSDLPLGEFQIWVFSNDLICVSNASAYPQGDEVYKRIYHGDFDLDNYRGIIGDDMVMVVDPADTAIKITPQEVAAQFGLIWFN